MKKRSIELLAAVFLSTLTTGALCSETVDSDVEETQSQMLQVLQGKGSTPSGEVLEYYGKAKGYLAVPSTAGPHGSVILIHEWNGLVDRVKQVADALANQGYVAVGSGPLFRSDRFESAGEHGARTRDS